MMEAAKPERSEFDSDDSAPASAIEDVFACGRSSVMRMRRCIRECELSSLSATSVAAIQ